MLEPGRIAVCVSPSVAIAAFSACALGLEQTMSHADCPTFLQRAILIHGFQRPGVRDAWAAHRVLPPVAERAVALV